LRYDRRVKILSTHGPESCAECPVGHASGTGQGGFCPFIDRQGQAGAILFEADSRAEYVWFVKRGTVVLSRPGADDRGVRAVRFAGSFVGLEALVNDSYVDTARAVTDVVLCGATRDGIDAWVGPKGSPPRTALEITLRSSIGDRLRSGSREGSASQRVAAWLLAEGPTGQALELPRQIVADLLGMRPETLSRAIAELKSRGAIEATRTTLTIVDADALAALAADQG
jgi:CRP-like cAMP-binding protein